MKQCVFALLLGDRYLSAVRRHHRIARRRGTGAQRREPDGPHQSVHAGAGIAREPAAAARWPAGRRAARPLAPPDRSRWAREPMKVFDNLYYVGEREYSSWAVTTSAGHHHHRSDLRLFSRRAGRRRIEEARARSRANQIRRRQSRAPRSRGRRVVPAGAVRRARPADRARLGHARAQQAELAEAEARHGRRRSASS